MGSSGPLLGFKQERFKERKALTIRFLRSVDSFFSSSLAQFS